MTTSGKTIFLIAAGCMLALLGCLAPAFAQEKAYENSASYISFQAPGCQSTYPASINSSLSITGGCAIGFAAFHGFVRDARGTITVFDPPGSIATQSTGINAEGVIAGYFQDTSLVQHGFVRSIDGTFTLFDFPSTFGGRVTGINKSGTTVGSYFEPNSQSHGFMRARDGSIISFDPPGSANTFVDSIDDKGIIAGTYLTSNGGYGFIRDLNGEFTSFEPTATTTGFFLTLPGYSINGSGTITGTYSDPRYADGDVGHGFVRSQIGTITTFDPPGSASTTALDINARGAVTGYYMANGLHGFVRSSHGTIVPFDYPGGTNTTGVSINYLGVITGTYQDSGGGSLGFVRLPPADSGDDQFKPGTYILTDNHGLYVDGGFYLYGDPTVRLWVYVAGNPNQYWSFIKVPGGFTMLDQGASQYASDAAGQLVESRVRDVWTVTPAPEGYTLKNNRTGLFLTDPTVQSGAVTLTEIGSVWQFSMPLQ